MQTLSSIFKSFPFVGETPLQPPGFHKECKPALILSGNRTRGGLVFGRRGKRALAVAAGDTSGGPILNININNVGTGAYAYATSFAFKFKHLRIRLVLRERGRESYPPTPGGWL